MRLSCAAVAMGLLAGCAGPGGTALQPGAPGVVSSAGLTPQRAKELVVTGRSTRPDVAAALGRPIAIPFETGWEVWVYRWPGADPGTRAAAELVVLFPPSGPAHKVRIRPGYPPAR